MVCAFLLAELDSPLWSSFIHKFPRTDLGLVTHPSVNDPVESLIRRVVLAAYRGYGIGTYLFTGFPDDVTWSRATVTTEELGVILPRCPRGAFGSRRRVSGTRRTSGIHRPNAVSSRRARG
jgi:hypothetical protein